jgi:hypothetical protein
MEERAGRARRFRKRRFKRVPWMPRPVKALWDLAAEEERKAAHETAATILEWWTGRAKKGEAAARLKVPPLRLWQLSQRALAGMVAGLLRQPRWRRTEGQAMDPADDPKALRRRIKELERELALTEELVSILRGYPANRGRTDLPGDAEEKPIARKRRRAAPSAGAAKADRAVAPEAGPAPGR